MKALFTTALAVLLTGCSSLVSERRQTATPPFSIQFLNRPGNVGALSPDHPEYDPALPGFHILGKSNGFVYARVVPTPSAKRSKALTLALQAAYKTDEFTLTTPVLAALTHPINRTSLWMFSISQGDTIVRNSLHRKGEAVVISEGPTDYFRYDIVDDSIHVTFLPKAMALLSEECRLTWTHSLDR